MKQVQIVWNPLARPQHRLGTVTVHDQRDTRHVMGCARCQGLPPAPQSGDYTIPFWEAYEKENEKWQ